MSLWTEKYEEKFKTIPYPNFIVRDHIDECIENFVGTKAQIAAEETRLKEQGRLILDTYRCRYNEQVNILLDNWNEDLYRDYLGSSYPRELHDIIYAEAYEDGHSSGYAEVENIYTHKVDSYVKVFELGRKSYRKEVEERIDNLKIS